MAERYVREYHFEVRQNARGFWWVYEDGEQIWDASPHFTAGAARRAAKRWARRDTRREKQERRNTFTYTLPL